MTRSLRGLEASLGDARVAIARWGLEARTGKALTDDYAFAHELVRLLIDGIERGTLTDDELERVWLNGDLVQLAFHLDEELTTVRTPESEVVPEALAASLSFMTRHIARLRTEYEDRRHARLPSPERDLLRGLTLLTRREFDSRWLDLYRSAGYARPFVDKFYRDYSLDGIPDGLLFELESIAQAGLDPRTSWDVHLCVLKGGLPFGLLLGLLGVPDQKLRYVRCGRVTGSHLDRRYVVEPLGFDWHELRGQRVLVVENNIASGATLTHLLAVLDDLELGRLGLFADYVLSEVAGLNPENLVDRLASAPERGHPRPPDTLHLGPYPYEARRSAHRIELEERLNRSLAQQLAALS